MDAFCGRGNQAKVSEQGSHGPQSVHCIYDVYTSIYMDIDIHEETGI